MAVLSFKEKRVCQLIMKKLPKREMIDSSEFLVIYHSSIFKMSQLVQDIL